jgi:hypothetical protein
LETGACTVGAVAGVSAVSDTPFNSALETTSSPQSAPVDGSPVRVAPTVDSPQGSAVEVATGPTCDLAAVPSRGVGSFEAGAPAASTTPGPDLVVESWPFCWCSRGRRPPRPPPRPPRPAGPPPRPPPPLLLPRGAKSLSLLFSREKDAEDGAEAAEAFLSFLRVTEPHCSA